MVRFRIEADGGIAICRLAGELDSYGAATSREAMAAISAFRSVVVDMAGVTFVDSAGLGVIVAGIRRMRAIGADVVLAAPRPPVERVLRMAGFDRIAAMAGTVEEGAALLAHATAS